MPGFSSCSKVVKDFYHLFVTFPCRGIKLKTCMMPLLEQYKKAERGSTRNICHYFYLSHIRLNFIDFISNFYLDFHIVNGPTSYTAAKYAFVIPSSKSSYSVIIKLSWHSFVFLQQPPVLHLFSLLSKIFYPLSFGIFSTFSENHFFFFWRLIFPRYHSKIPVRFHFHHYGGAFATFIPPNPLPFIGAGDKLLVYTGLFVPAAGFAYTLNIPLCKLWIF